MTETDNYKRNEFGNPICEICGTELEFYRAEVDYVDVICPNCDNEED